MYLIREIFNAKPGKAKELVKKFKAAAPHFERSGGGKNHRILTDVATTYWTVIMQYEVDDLGTWAKELRNPSGNAEMQEIMKGYMDLIEGGSREIYLVE